MKDLLLQTIDSPETLARLGEAVGRAGVSIEGGALFVSDGMATAHYLVVDDSAARSAAAALREAGFDVLKTSDVVVLRLHQDEPGQLGKIGRRMAEARVSIEAQYSDHQQQLILVVDALEDARRVAEQWMRDRES
jgi:hypothetical protein